MDIISFNEASTANGRIKSFIENPDSTSGIVTVPKTIASGETVTIPAGRVAVLPNVQVDGTLNVDGEVFIPSGATLSKVVELEGDQTITGVKTFSSTIIGSITGNAETASSTPTLSALPNYVWSASTTPTGYPLGVQTSFVRPEGGFPNYGSLVNVMTYSAGGGSLQLYVPYSALYGGNTLKVRFGNYEVNNGNSWTDWKTLITDENISSYNPVAAFVANDTRVKTALNASGEAPIYACRAWVNFDGTGAVAIRASGNVSSVTDNGVGDYTVNFTTAMPDANYSCSVTAGTNGSGAFYINTGGLVGDNDISSRRIYTARLAMSGEWYHLPADQTTVVFQVFR